MRSIAWWLVAVVVQCLRGKETQTTRQSIHGASGVGTALRTDRAEPGAGMNRMDSSDGVFVSAVLLTAIIVTTIFAHSCGVTHTEVEAVKAGAGEYYLDTNYVRQFRWIPK